MKTWEVQGQQPCQATSTQRFLYAGTICTAEYAVCTTAPLPPHQNPDEDTLLRFYCRCCFNIYFVLFIQLFFYLTVPGLSCSM